MINYQIENVAERRARKERDIKELFWQLTIQEHMPFMEAYEAVGYQFYLSAGQIRDILSRRSEKCGKPAQ
jgi:hypothetical protein